MPHQTRKNPIPKDKIGHRFTTIVGWIALVAICFGLLVFIMNGSSTRYKVNSGNTIEIIHSHFDGLKETCPITMGEGIIVTNVSYSDEDKLISYNLLFSNLYNDQEIKELAANFAKNIRFVALYSYSIHHADDESVALYDALINEGFSYCWCLYKDDGSESGQYINKCVIDSYDLASAKAYAIQHPDEAKREILNDIVKMYNDQLPFDLDDDMEYLSTYLYYDRYQTLDTLIVFRLRIPQEYELIDVRETLFQFYWQEMNKEPMFDNALIAGCEFNTGIGIRVIKGDFTDSLMIAFGNDNIKSIANELYKKRHNIYSYY